MSRKISRGQRAHLLWLCSDKGGEYPFWPQGCKHGMWLVEKRGEPAVPAFLICIGCGKWERARSADRVEA